MPEPRIERDAPAVELRLAISKSGLGLELARTARLGCLDVTELAVSLPGMRFPLDVSGGVSRFRHRRGQLLRVGAELTAFALGRWAAPRLRGVVGADAPAVSVVLRPAGATLALSDFGDLLDSRRPPRVLVFELALAARDGDLSVTVTEARGAGLTAPATALAIGAVQALIGGVATRDGARFVIAKAAERVARALWPDAGARAPEAADVTWTAIGGDAETLVLHAERGGAEAGATGEAMRAHEAALVTREADNARVSGDLARARALDIAALARAPRHPEVCRRIAEIDQLAGGRAEAALSTLSELPRDPATHLGTLAAELHAEAGDADAAVAALVRAGETEPAPELGARAFERAAELVKDPLDALVWLDLAIARAPAVGKIRWSRVARRLEAGRVEEALGDVEHLEALSTGLAQKYAVWRRAGDAFRAAGLRAETATLYERALRYLPDDPAAIAGLGAALVACGRAPRGASLLAHAIELQELARKSTSAMVLDLARVLAEQMKDCPAAIARVRGIPHDAPEALVARGLEARWRAALGDLAGASLAFARLRDHADTAPSAAADVAVPLLLEAARFEHLTRQDLLAAQRHLACALRLRPHAADVARAYREICAKIAPPPATALGASYAEPSLLGGPYVEPAGRALDVTFDDDAPAADSEDSLRVEELTRRLQSNPDDDSIVDELSRLLMRLGRGLELLALLSARLEDASKDRRAELLPTQRAVLMRLEAEATADGRRVEATLFSDALRALEA